jgi:hypothetical protein
MTEQQIIETLATKVMGWDTHMDVDGNEYWVIDGKWFPKKCWNPLHNIADAWQVVDKFKAMRDTDDVLFYTPYIIFNNDESYFFTIYSSTCLSNILEKSTFSSLPEITISLPFGVMI